MNLLTSLKSDLKSDLQSVCRYAGVIAAIAIFYLVLEGIGITCPILFLTGVSCAGCGMSRAWFSFLTGHPAAALGYHPLFWMLPVVAIIWILRRRIPRRILMFLAWAASALFLLVYILRMVDTTDAIVVFCPQNGILWRFYTAVFSIFPR